MKLHYLIGLVFVVVLTNVGLVTASVCTASFFVPELNDNGDYYSVTGHVQVANCNNRFSELTVSSRVEYGTEFPQVIESDGTVRPYEIFCRYTPGGQMDDYWHRLWLQTRAPGPQCWFGSERTCNWQDSALGYSAQVTRPVNWESSFIHANGVCPMELQSNNYEAVPPLFYTGDGSIATPKLLKMPIPGRYEVIVSPVFEGKYTCDDGTVRDFRLEGEHICLAGAEYDGAGNLISCDKYAYNTQTVFCVDVPYAAPENPGDPAPEETYYDSRCIQRTGEVDFDSIICPQDPPVEVDPGELPPPTVKIVVNKVRPPIPPPVVLQNTYCGDAVTQSTNGLGTTEQCDDGNFIDSDGCTNTCQSTTCGDSIINRPNSANEIEQCDAGLGNGQAPSSITNYYSGYLNYLRPSQWCSNSCQRVQQLPPYCGDGIVQRFPQTCVSNNGHLTSCLNLVNVQFNALTLPTVTCSDGDCNTADTNPDNDDECANGACDEECDDGNQYSTDACTSVCKVNVCGDGYLKTGTEQCDDRNTVAGDGCSPTCTIEQPVCQTCCNYNGIADNSETGIDCGNGICPDCHDLLQAEWRNTAGTRISSVTIDTPVILYTKTRFAPGAIVNFNVLVQVEDVNGNIALEPITIETPITATVLSDKTASATWSVTNDIMNQAILHTSLLGKITDNAVFIFEASEDTSGARIKSNLLTVAKPVCAVGTPQCGNALIDTGETCDFGMNGLVSRNDGTTRSEQAHPFLAFVPPASGVTKNAFTCSNLCQSASTPVTGSTPTCGNGIINTGETCDFGTAHNNNADESSTLDNTPDGLFHLFVSPSYSLASQSATAYRCSNLCAVSSRVVTNSFCGDAVKDASEGCDFGTANNNGVTASNTISPFSAFTAPAYGVSKNSYTCNNQCILTTTAVSQMCGDGIVQAGHEVCDYGASRNTGRSFSILQPTYTSIASYPAYPLTQTVYACNSCQSITPRELGSYCGDYVIDSSEGEECDPGDDTNNAWCNNDCTFKSTSGLLLCAATNIQCQISGSSEFTTCNNLQYGKRLTGLKLTMEPTQIPNDFTVTIGNKDIAASALVLDMPVTNANYDSTNGVYVINNLNLLIDKSGQYGIDINCQMPGPTGTASASICTSVLPRKDPFRWVLPFSPYVSVDNSYHVEQVCCDYGSTMQNVELITREI